MSKAAENAVAITLEAADTHRRNISAGVFKALVPTENKSSYIHEKSVTKIIASKTHPDRNGKVP